MLEVSFCIPTYNRGDKVYHIVTNILNNCTNSRFEIVVLDNRSSDSTITLLNSICDSRFRYIANDAILLGPINILQSLYYARGRFAFLCLDKDYILPEGINGFLDHISSFKNLALGHCELNNSEYRNHEIFESGLESTLKMSYMSAHPSGMFFNTEYLKRIDFINKIKNKNKIFGFYPDMINGELSMLGSSTLFRMPLVRTEKIEECEAIPSHTFTNYKDLYFLPHKRLECLLAYATHINTLSLSSVNKYRVLKDVFRKNLSSATFGYKLILQNRALCTHHYIKTRKVNLFELLIIDLRFSFGFLRGDIPFSFYQKIRICLSQHINFIKKTF
jgi:glycosyltransferase involved in cell wall biosynthesis